MSNHHYFTSQNKNSAARQQFIDDCLQFLNQTNKQTLSSPTNDKHPQRIDCNHIAPNRYLTAQEGKCIALLLDGHNYQAIGDRLELSVRTIEFYLNNVKKKFNCKRKKDLIILFKGKINL